MDLCLERLDRRDPEFGIDFSHMHLYDLTAFVEDFHHRRTGHLYLDRTAGGPRTGGFALERLSGRFYMSQGCLGFEDAEIVTPNSAIHIPYISLVGNSWDDYKDFVGQVRLDAAVRNSRVSTDDIAWFAPACASGT